MANGGTKLYCPQCEKIQICTAESLSLSGEPSGQRWYNREHADIQWFRRSRECQTCFHGFITAEAEETLLDELSNKRTAVKLLEKKLIEAREKHANFLYSRNLWLDTEQPVPSIMARALVSASAWWLRHPSGSPARTPGHSKHVYCRGIDLVIDFGGNTFLPGRAIIFSRKILNDQINSLVKGEKYSRKSLVSRLKSVIQTCVSNHAGEIYQGQYPMEGDDLVFGSNSIDVKDAANYLIDRSELESLV